MTIRIDKTNTTSYRPPAFKGYDARPLKAVVMSINDEPKSFNIIKQMAQIGEREGFKVFFINQSKNLYTNLDNIKKFFKICIPDFSKWAQDIAVITPSNEVLYCDMIQEDTCFAKKLSTLTNAKPLNYDRTIDGGNLFFTKNDGKNELFVGAEELQKNDIETLKQRYNVSKVIPIPQADFHLDMFIRPLNNKQILVADDRLTIQAINQAIANLHKCKDKTSNFDKIKSNLKTLLKNFKNDVKYGMNPRVEEIAAVLRENDYEPIFVPGRLYYTVPGCSKDDLVHYLNYMNAVVHQKKNGEMVFITNKSKLNEDYGITPEISEKIGFDFEKMFIKSIEPYIKKENIYFIEGTHNQISELLEKGGGGIHCLCNEIPAEISQQIKPSPIL